MRQQSLPTILKTKRLKKRTNPTTIIVYSFLFVIVIGTLLLMLPFASKSGQSAGLLGALFTATSATCVTGLVVFDTYTQFSLFGQVVILALIQVGGLGLLTIATFFYVAAGRRLGFKSMQVASESISLTDSSKAKRLLRVVVGVAGICELIGAVLLSFAFVPMFGLRGIFLAVFTSISAFCNAGFDIFGVLGEYSSLTTFYAHPYVLFVVCLLIISGGLGFLVWQDIMTYHKTRHLRMHTKLVLLMTGGLILVGTVGFAVLEWNNPSTLGELSVFDKITNSAFQAVTTRTAGFNSVDIASTQSITKLFMIILMFIGAAPGGTGGGIKVTTVAVLLVAVLSVIHGRSDAVAFGRRINQKIVYRSLAIFMISLVAVTFSSVILYFHTFVDFSAINNIFEAVSAYATVGLSVGVTGHMEPVAQVATMLTMLMGRVGPLSLAISLTIKGKKDIYANIVLPQANIPVG